MLQLLLILVKIVNLAVMFCVFYVLDWIGQRVIGRYLTFEEIQWILYSPVLAFLFWVYCIRQKDWWKIKKWRNKYER